MYSLESLTWLTICQNFDCPIYEGINYDETPFLQFDMLSPVFTCTGEIT
jgi:hypothetical protein